MKILLIGGGTGGHITPLLAVAKELKRLAPEAELIGICEKQAKFAELYLKDPAISKVYQVRAGKYRRYSGQSALQRLFDLKTLILNLRDVLRTLAGYIESKRLLRGLKPDIILVKGGFVAVPIGLAAAKLKIPFITHDSDSSPGLANRIISRWATKHATGMSAELYNYPRSITVFTGIPVADKFVKVSPSLRATYRDVLGLGVCRQVVTVVGGSQGAGQLNEDIISVLPRLMQKHEGLGLVHIAGKANEKTVSKRYDSELLANERNRVVVKGFVDDIYIHQGAADIVVSRASATVTAELALQALPVVLVPGNLAGAHQDKNAEFYLNKKAAKVVAHGDTEGLYKVLDHLLSNPAELKQLGTNLNKLAKPDAAIELAQLVLSTARKK